MGCCKSKSDEDEGADTPTYQTKNIYYDTDGNLRCGNVTNDKDEELRQVTLGDAFSTKLKEEVCVIVITTLLHCTTTVCLVCLPSLY